MQTMHLFAGAGGGLLADLILGHTPIVAVEWDRYCCQVLRERAADGWIPNLQVWEGDVRLFDPSEYSGRVDCIHAGFPCQDISNAGKQMGVSEGTRSGLYREVLRIADIVRPEYLYLENVAAILSNGLGTVLADLASRGYDSRWICLRASDVGAPHHRDRWWCLADRNSNSQSASAINAGQIRKSYLANTNDDEGRGESSPKPLQREARLELGGGCESVADTNGSQREGNCSAIGGYEEYADSCPPGWWAAESDVGRVVDGMAYRMDRLKALGNGQVPLQAAVAWKLLGGPDV